MKISESKKAMISLERNESKEERSIEIAINGIKAGIENNIIIKMTELSDNQINDLRKQLENE